MADDGIQITYEQVGTAITDITSLRRTIEEIFDEFGASVRKVNDAGLRGKGGEGYEQAYNSLKLTFPTFDRALWLILISIIFKNKDVEYSTFFICQNLINIFLYLQKCVILFT